MSELSGLSVRIQVTIDDVFQAIASYNWRRFWWFLILFPLVGLFSLSVAVYGMANRVSALIPLAGGILCIAWGLLIAFVLPYLSARSTMKSSKTLQQLGQCNFSETGIDLIGQTFRTQTEWTNIHKVFETRVSLMVFLSAQAFLLVPKRFLTNDDVVLIRDLIRNHVCGEVTLQQ
jgi:hypothetical protein